MKNRTEQNILDNLIFLEHNQYIINSKFYLEFQNFGHFRLVFVGDKGIVLYKDNCQGGKRICRGLYKSKKGLIINADVNGSFNILRKCNPEFYYNDRIKDVSLHPIRFNI